MRFNALLKILTADSASPFQYGHYGAVVICFMQHLSKNNFISFDTNCGRLEFVTLLPEKYLRLHGAFMLYSKNILNLNVNLNNKIFDLHKHAKRLVHFKLLHLTI